MMSEKNEKKKIKQNFFTKTQFLSLGTFDSDTVTPLIRLQVTMNVNDEVET